MSTLRLVTCCRVIVTPSAKPTWECDFLAPPSLSEIREAVRENLGATRSPNGILLDVIDGIDSHHEQRLVRYTLQDEKLTLRAFTTSGLTCLGEIRLCEGGAVICRNRND